MVSICASLFCAPLMMAGVNAILPEIGVGLHASASQLALVGAAYSLGLAVFQLSSGTLGDIRGHRRLFLTGAIIFALSGSFLGLAPGMPFFLIARFTQGLGGAILSASGLALLASCAAPEKRATYLGFSSFAVYAGIACGPPIAGLITASLGWRWVFWTSALAAIIVFILMRFAASQEWRPAKGRKFDWQGCFLYALAMTALTVAAAQMGENLRAGFLCVAFCLLFLVIFYFWERRGTFPILNFSLLAQNRVLTLSTLAALVNYASFFGVLFYFSFYLQIGKGIGIRETGLILAFQPLIQTLITPLASRLCNLWQPGGVSALGAMLCGCGLLSAAFLKLASPLFSLFATQALLGAGISLFSLANTAIILESAGRMALGQASGLVGAARTAGQLAGMVFITASLGFFLGNKAVSVATLDPFMHAMRLNLVIFGALNLCAVGLVFIRNRRQSSGHLPQDWGKAD